MTKVLAPIAAVTLLAAGVSACASASASPKGSEPGLVIPAPPPHVVPITPEPIVEPVGEIPGGTSSAPAGVSAPRTGRGTREAAPRPAATESRPEAKPGETAAPPEPLPTPVAPPSGPPPQLRTADSAGTEGTVRTTIERARQILATVDYRHLTIERRKAYDDAKKFADQADEALKQGNVVFAQGVAAKAETLAKELSTR